MSKAKSTDEILNHQQQAIQKLDNYLKDCVNSADAKLIKKSDVLSFWIETYVDYLIQEPTFQPKRIMNYSRGNIIRVNFGFRVGTEMGGLHYAVVIDKVNIHNASVLTVIPLSSTDGKQVHPTNVDLGAELYSKVSAQHSSLKKDLSNELASVVEMLSTLEMLKSKATDDKNEEALSKVHTLSETLSNKKKDLDSLLASINRYSSEIGRMKSGSMAVMNQITTVSKQRIYTPRKSSDFLYGISLSDVAMDKINKKLTEKLIK